MRKLAYITLALFVTFGALISTPFMKTTVASEDIEWFWVNPYPQGNDLNAIAYGNGLFVAVGSDGVIITSSNGESWEIQDSGTSQSLFDVIWCGNQFVSVGKGGTILTSPGGITWTKQNSGTSYSTFYGVDYNGSLLVATSSNHIRYSSDNGITWNLVSIDFPDPNNPSQTIFTRLKAITSDGTQFVVVGDRGVVVTSTDGIIWNKQNTPVSSILNAIAFANSQYVAVGQAGTVLTSSNGIDWDERSTPTASSLLDIVWDGSQYVAVGNPGGGENILVITSEDGILWTKHDEAFRASLFGISYGGNKHVAVGSFGSIATSTDGASWDKISEGVTQNLKDVIWAGSQYVAVGQVGTIVTSTDGLNWNEHSLTMADVAPLTLLPELRGIAWNGSRFVAVGTYGVIVTSPDGTTWTKQVSGQSTSATLNKVIWAGDPLNRFIVVGSGGRILTSEDGESWTQRAAGLTSVPLFCISWSGSQFVATGMNVVLTSPDGINWTKYNVANGFNDVIWDGTQFVAVQAGTAIYTSVDGTTWNNRVSSTPNASLLYSVVWDGSKYVAVGRTILSSSDVENWVDQQTFPTGELWSISCSGSQFIVVGAAGTILAAGEPPSPSDYDLGYEAGYQDGYEDGYSEGQQDGYNQGYEAGLGEGYQDGYSQGTSDGYTQGHEDGYSAGYEAGMSDGYTEGYNDGIETYRDETPPAGAVHAYPNLLWSPNNKMVEVTISGYVRDELSIKRDSGGTGVSSAYLLVNDSEVIPLSLDEDGNYNLVLKFEAKKGAAYVVELYAADTTPEVPNEGLIDTTYIQVPRNQGSKS